VWNTTTTIGPNDRSEWRGTNGVAVGRRVPGAASRTSRREDRSPTVHSRTRILVNSEAARTSVPDYPDGGEPMATDVEDDLQSTALVEAGMDGSRTGDPVAVQELLADALESADGR
jgi:hypothetical protein